MVRKCIYTGLDADAKDNILPRYLLGGEELHNWAAHVPACEAYKNVKKDRAPTELELKAYKIFYQMELLRLELRSLEIEQTEIQSKLKENLSQNNPKKVVSRAKEKQIDQAIHENKVVASSDQAIKEALDNKKSLWD